MGRKDRGLQAIELGSKKEIVILTHNSDLKLISRSSVIQKNPQIGKLEIRQLSCTYIFLVYKMKNALQIKHSG